MITRNIRRGSVRVKVFRNRSTVAGKRYTRHELRWVDLNGKRHRLKRSNRAEALREARRIADELAKGSHVSELSLSDLASFRAGVVNLLPTGRTIELATAEYCDAWRTCPGVPMPELARFYARHHVATSADLTVGNLVERFLASKRRQGVAGRTEAELRRQLYRFAADHRCRAEGLTAAGIQRWVDGLPKLGARSRNNFLDAVQAVFRMSELDGHPERSAVQRLQPAREAAPLVKLWRPAEFRALLDAALLPFRRHNGRTRREEHAAHLHLLPVLVLGGFAKMRSAEIVRTDWSDLRLDDGQAVLTAGLTKTRRRRIAPLPPAAVAWLRHCAKPAGRIWPWGFHKLSTDLRSLAKRCGLTWRPNALRKSANTYSMLIDPDAARVSREAGNSPAMLEKHYLAFDGVTRQDALDWFEIYPAPAGQKIVKLSSPNRPQK